MYLKEPKAVAALLKSEHLLLFICWERICCWVSDAGITITTVHLPVTKSSASSSSKNTILAISSPWNVRKCVQHHTCLFVCDIATIPFKVTAYFSRKQLLPFGLAEQNGHPNSLMHGWLFKNIYIQFCRFLQFIFLFVPGSCTINDLVSLCHATSVSLQLGLILLIFTIVYSVQFSLNSISPSSGGSPGPV